MELNFGKWIGCILCAISFSFAEIERVEVENAFWAYDDGKIGEEELEELLCLIENGDVRGACAEWEMLGGEPCRKGLLEQINSWKMHGTLAYAVSLDSMGSIRSERTTATFEAFRFAAEARLKSEERGPVLLEHWRIKYKDRYSYSVLGNIAAADVHSAVSLEKRTGNVWNLGRRNWQAGTVLLTDSTAGVHALIGMRNRLEFSLLGLFFRDGFRDAFLRVRSENADAQISFSEGAKTPLFFASARSDKTLPFRLRFRVYLHENAGNFGIFHVPKMVEKNRAFGDASVTFRFFNWTVKGNGSYAVPLDSGRSRLRGEMQTLRQRKTAAVGAGMRFTVIGDSLSTMATLLGGIRLFAAESLFCEWRWTTQVNLSKSLYEIRPGVRVIVSDGVSAKVVLLLNGPGSKPVVVREETEMRISKNLYGKSLLELRAGRVRDLHLYRFGLELMGKI